MQAKLIAAIPAVFLGLATALPTSVRSLGPHSKPARDYAAAMQLAKTFRRGDTAAATGGESIILVHGARTPQAIVLFHGGLIPKSPTVRGSGSTPVRESCHG